MTLSATQSAGSGVHTRASRWLETLAALFLLSLVACGDETEKPPPAAPVASISVVAPATTLERSLTMQLTADVRDAQGDTLTNRAVVWSTSDAAIAEVNASTGQVRGKGRGKVTITATSEGKSGQTQLDIFVLYKSIQLGDVFSCDVGSGGVASCWGFNGFGVLGNGTQSGSTSTPADVMGGLAFTQVSTSTLHVCGLTAAGEASCWGPNSTGQGGTGDTQGPSLTPRKVVGGLTFSSISAGDTHTCALTPMGVAYCWGNNGSGQLGVNSDVDSLETPTAVAGGLTFKNISAGVRATCGVTTSNQAYCWGTDESGELGNGGPISHMTTDISRVPVAVAGGLSFSSVSVGQFYACGITTSGSVYCWGRNDVGRLGNGGTSDTSAP
ncbi:MAG TPA: Ig-like domain-containing protein, partial [Archangium sp.]|nr:Ig-like domain-containing protein [Archangium sp.]